MATRSLIGVNLNNGITKTVYCHWDGYPSGVGQTLMENYTSPSASTTCDLTSLSYYKIPQVLGNKFLQFRFDDSNQVLLMQV